MLFGEIEGINVGIVNRWHLPDLNTGGCAGRNAERIITIRCRHKGVMSANG